MAKGYALTDDSGNVLDGSNNPLMPADYAGLSVDDNAVATVIPAVDSYTKVLDFTTSMPETVSSSSDLTADITIGATGDYELTMVSSAESAGANKTFEWDVFELESAVSITNITQATPAVVTASGHGLSNGDKVKIDGVAGMIEVNDRVFTVAGVSGTTFQLEDDNGGAINSGGFGVYGEGGSTYKATETGCHAHRKFGVASDVGSMSGNGIATLTASNTLELYVENVTDGTNLTHESISFKINRLG